MRTLKFVLQYEGTDYVGWQRQASGMSIQGLLEDALRPIEGSAVTVHGAGRTDAGVHASGQVASVRLAAAIEPATLARALNAVLPVDVRVASVELAAEDFHARFSSTGKVYDYQVVNAPFVSPFLRRYVWHVSPALDLDAMIAASAPLVGTHDFAAFQGAGSVVHSTVRTVRRLAWGWGHGLSPNAGPPDGPRPIHGLTPPSPDLPIVMRIEGDGFLRHMVRSIAGTLVEVGLGRWPASATAEILASRDRARAGTTAPAAGLVLREVLYSHKIQT